MEIINNLLNQISIISKKNDEILSATGARFNMFRICGVNHYENTHSAIIAELLNTNGTHGLKSKFLDCFIESLGEYSTINTFNSEKSRVYTEYPFAEGRIDILIEDDQNKSIIIENKIYAKDQFEQLKRYSKYSQRYQNGCQILYLTLCGNNATEQSGKGVDYLAISYEETIINWLEKCVSISSRFPAVRETLIQYINHLKQLTNQDMDTKNKEEITEVLSKVENLRAAKAVFQNYSNIFNHLATKYFSPKIEDYAKQKGLNYHYERSEELYIRFHFTNPSWQEKCWIGFTFEGGRCHYGLVNNPNVYKISEQSRKTLHDNLNRLNVSPRKESNWWPFYAHYENLSLETWENDIINSDKFLTVCKEKIDQLLLAMKDMPI